MALQNKLKAFVRFDGSGRVIPSSLILQKSKPKVGNWKEINATQCCNDITSTTTTTTSSSTTTTTTSGSVGVPFSALLGPSGGVNEPAVCNGNATTLYTNGANPDQVGTYIYIDSELTTTLRSQNQYLFAVNGHVNLLDSGGNVLQVNIYDCSVTTTTTTTAPPVLNFIGRVGNTSSDACNAASNVTLYTTGPLNFIYPQSGNVVYYDQELTQPVTELYVASPGIGQVFDCTNGLLSNQQSC